MAIFKRSKSEDKIKEGLGTRESPRIVTPKQLVQRGLIIYRKKTQWNSSGNILGKDDAIIRPNWENELRAALSGMQGYHK
jgi:hypothetical protein